MSTILSSLPKMRDSNEMWKEPLIPQKRVRYTNFMLNEGKTSNFLHISDHIHHHNCQAPGAKQPHAADYMPMW
jgi:hypothetical protein